MAECCEHPLEQSEQTDRQLLMMTEAECRLACETLAGQQAMLSAEHLVQLHGCLLGPRGLFALLVRELEELGRLAPLLEDVAALANRELRTQADKALCFVMGHHRWRSVVPNPFRAMSRERLCCLVYDDSAGYTLIERYAALLTLRQLDSQFFTRLIDTTRKSVERRVVFHGLLEHYDTLLPVERCVYPEGYRAAQQQHLERELELYGDLTLSQPLSVMLARYSTATLMKKLGVRQTPRGRA